MSCFIRYDLISSLLDSRLVDPNLIADQRYFRAKYLQNGEEH